MCKNKNALAPEIAVEKVTDNKAQKKSNWLRGCVDAFWINTKWEKSPWEFPSRPALVISRNKILLNPINNCKTTCQTDPKASSTVFNLNYLFQALISLTSVKLFSKVLGLLLQTCFSHSFYPPREKNRDGMFLIKTEFSFSGVPKRTRLSKKKGNVWVCKQFANEKSFLCHVIFFNWKIRLV